MKRSLVFVFVFLVMAVPILAQDADTVVIRGFGNIVTFNPALTTDGASQQAFSLLFPTPMEVDSFTGEVIPGLTTWEVSDDGLTYTFHILENANWSDGTPISSADMKFVIEAAQQDTINTSWEAEVEQIAAVNIIDEKTYEIVLKEINCAALGGLQTIRFLPAHKYAADFSDFESSDFNMNPDISGGPYILDEWAPDEFQRFHANADFWGGAPHIPNLINRVIGEQAVAVQAIQSGEIDYTYFQGDLFEQIANRDNLQYSAFPQVSVNFLSLNWVDPSNPQPAYDADGNPIEQTPHPLFSDVRVRQAVAMGWNKMDVLETLGGAEGGTPLVGVVAPAFAWAYNTDVAVWPYDPEAAKALLDEAGWTDSDGDGVRECNGCSTAEEGTLLAFTIRYSDILQLFETSVLVAQDQLSDIGFQVDLELVEWSNYISDVYLGQAYDATAMSNSTATDPNTFTTLLLSQQDIPGAGNNLASYVNPEVDALIEQARSVPDAIPPPVPKSTSRFNKSPMTMWLMIGHLSRTFSMSPTTALKVSEPGPAWVFYGYTSHVHEWSLQE